MGQAPGQFNPFSFEALKSQIIFSDALKTASDSSEFSQASDQKQEALHLAINRQSAKISLQLLDVTLHWIQQQQKIA